MNGFHPNLRSVWSTAIFLILSFFILAATLANEAIAGGQEFKGKIERMALVGNRSWGKYVTKLAAPFYAQEAEWFTDVDKAWDWVKS